jgi:heat shock protein beta
MKVGEYVFVEDQVQCLTFATDGEEEDSKEAQKKLEEKFKPLLEWLKEETKDVVRNGEYIRTSCVGLVAHVAFSVVISNRLVTSACAIVADTLGYTANIEKLMSEFPFPLPHSYLQ